MTLNSDTATPAVWERPQRLRQQSKNERPPAEGTRKAGGYTSRRHLRLSRYELLRQQQNTISPTVYLFCGATLRLAGILRKTDSEIPRHLLALRGACLPRLPIDYQSSEARDALRAMDLHQRALRRGATHAPTRTISAAPTSFDFVSTALQPLWLFPPMTNPHPGLTT